MQIKSVNFHEVRIISALFVWMGWGLKYLPCWFFRCVSFSWHINIMPLLIFLFSINISTMKIILCLLFFMLTTTCRSYRKKTSIRLQLQILRLLKYRKPTDDLCQMTYNSVKTLKDMLPFWDLRYVTVLINIINHW